MQGHPALTQLFVGASVFTTFSSIPAVSQFEKKILPFVGTDSVEVLLSIATISLYGEAYVTFLNSSCLLLEDCS